MECSRMFTYIQMSFSLACGSNKHRVFLISNPRIAARMMRLGEQNEDWFAENLVSDIVLRCFEMFLFQLTR